MEYVDPQIVEGFRMEVTQQLAEAVEFAVQYKKHNEEDDPDELRQAAQDALEQLLTPLVESAEDAYRKSPLQAIDLSAVALLFKRLAIRAKLHELCGRSPDHPQQFTDVRIETRRGIVEGTLYDVLDHEGMESAHVGDEFVPVVAIMELEETS